MKAKEVFKNIKNKNDKELVLNLVKEYEHLRELRFKAKLRELKNFNEIKISKKTIAQILTILRENIEKSFTKEKENEKKAKR